MEDLFVERLATGLHELNVVNEKNVVFAITLVQCKLRTGLNRANEVVEERLGRHVEHLAPGIVLLDVIANRVQEVCLTQS